MVASVSVSGALFSPSAPGSALDLTFLWQLAQLLLNSGCAAARTAGPTSGGFGAAGWGGCGWALEAAANAANARKRRRRGEDISSLCNAAKPDSLWRNRTATRANRVPNRLYSLHPKWKRNCVILLTFSSTGTFEKMTNARRISTLPALIFAVSGLAQEPEVTIQSPPPVPIVAPL